MMASNKKRIIKLLSNDHNNYRININKMGGIKPGVSRVNSTISYEKAIELFEKHKNENINAGIHGVMGGYRIVVSIDILDNAGNVILREWCESIEDLSFLQ